MNERPPQPPNQENSPGTGERGVNSYGTDDPEEQARIEAARTAASEERAANRAKLERYVSYGLTPDDAEALIEHEEMVRQLRQAAGTGAERSAASSDEAPDSDREQEPRIQPRIYVRSLVDHTEGHDIGDWIDASQNLEDIHADVRNILARSLHAHWTGEPSEEWAIHDYDGFGALSLHEYESLDIVCALGKGIAEHGLAFAAWAEINDSRDLHTLERFSEAYLGSYDSRRGYAEQMVEQMDGESTLMRDVPEWLANYVRIDYEAMVHELETSGSVRFADHGGGVWVFDGRV